MSLYQKKQKEKRTRGKEFEAEVRRSWARVPSIWRMRIDDGSGATRPADELVLTPTFNLLIEMKRTEDACFKLAFLRTGQIKGLLEFEHVLPQNIGLVLVSFLNENFDETYAFRLFTALCYMRVQQRKSIPIEVFRRGGISAFNLPLHSENGERYYDLGRLGEWLPRL